MAIKAAEYEVGFNSATAITAFDQFKTAVKSGNADMDVAFRQLTGAFEQHNTVRRQGTKEVNNWVQFIKEEKQENRQLGFMVRNTAESVGGLAEAFGARGLGGAMLQSFGHFDQMKFALESIEVAGKGVGGRFGQIAGLLGGIAIPAGIAFAGFSAVKSIVEENEKRVKTLGDEFKKLNIAMGNVGATPLFDLQKQLNAAQSKTSTFSWGDAALSGLDRILGSQYAIVGAQAQAMEKGKAILETEKQIRDVIKEQLANRKALASLADEYKLIQAGQAENASRLAITEATFNTEEKSRVSSMVAHLALVQEQIVWAQGNLVVGKKQHMTLIDQIAAQTQINQLIAIRNRMQYDISNRAAEDKAYGSEQNIEARKWLRTLEEVQRHRKEMEAHNAPKTLDKLEGDFSLIRGVAEDPVEKAFRSDLLSIGTDLSGALSQGFINGFQTGKLQLADFTAAIMQSIEQIIARQAGIAAIAGIASLISGGSFLPIFAGMGGMTFGGGSTKSVGSGSAASGGDIAGLKSEIRALALSIRGTQRGSKGALAVLNTEELAVVVRRGDRILNRRVK